MVVPVASSDGPDSSLSSSFMAGIVWVGWQIGHSWCFEFNQRVWWNKCLHSKFLITFLPSNCCLQSEQVDFSVRWLFESQNIWLLGAISVTTMCLQCCHSSPDHLDCFFFEPLPVPDAWIQLYNMRWLVELQRQRQRSTRLSTRWIVVVFQPRN